MDEGVAGRGVSRLEFHGERPEASGRGALEGCAVVQQVAVQVDTNVSLEGTYQYQFVKTRLRRVLVNAFPSRFHQFEFIKHVPIAKSCSHRFWWE